MLKRTVSSIFLSNVTTRRLFSLSALTNRHVSEYPSRVNNKHRQFGRFHPRSPSFQDQMQRIHNLNKQDSTFDEIKPQFTQYNVARVQSKISSKKRATEDDDDNDIFSEEKDDLTMLGSDKKAFSSAISSQKPTSTAMSLNRKSDNLNIPLEVLIQPDLRDLYTDEEIHQSLELHINEMYPVLRPFTFDLAYLINESETLKRFVEMGVDVYRWNQPNIKAKYVLTLNFERDCVQHLVFLNEIGIKNKSLAQFLSYNPWIFKESIDDLRVRINYLENKGFTSENIRDILLRAPFLLNLSTKTLDSKFNWFQRKFHLTNYDFVLRAPKLLTLPLQDISDTYFKMNTHLSFESTELDRLFNQYPKLFIYDYKLIELNFDFLYNEMNLSRERLLDYPPVLKQSFQQLRTRCLYLKYVKRLQFDPTKPNFVSLKDLCMKTNELFCQHVTKTSLRHYLDFMKTL
ncbi:unnamed protein product [Adineta ricciae]|uniref:Uncharacterized protein n=1 Tax=Adineta ricciae TaxID=249248 RepID=A0A814K0J7_ADIRI|nr:unnamed protein product [Adineta ricciae]CAF1045083.1 unnamed protein product [Adineta ricciae]